MAPRVALLLAVVLSAPAAAEDVARDLGEHFPAFRSALVLRDVAGGRTVRHDPVLARARRSPCSTFKIPNSLIGLETGVIPDASYVLKWDGVRRPYEEWNRDHDLRSAMKHSVVWYYQELARRVGPARTREWVEALRYGNQDVSGGIVKDILAQEPPGPGIVYRGKTGSCQDPGAKDPHGWWVGSIEKEGRLYLYAARIEGPGASGRVCRPMAEKALAALGVLPAR